MSNSEPKATPARRPGGTGVEPSIQRAAFDCAASIYKAFLRYDENFKSITGRARERFDARDPIGAQRDRIERMGLWEKALVRTTAAVTRQLGHHARSRHLWNRVKEAYGPRIADFGDAELARTFFTSVTRRLFGTTGVDPYIEFVLELNPSDPYRTFPPVEIFINWGDMSRLAHDVLGEIQSVRRSDSKGGVRGRQERWGLSAELPWPSRDADARFLIQEIEKNAWRYYRHPNTLLRIELLKTVFYHGSRAFVVGKVDGQAWTAPFAMGLSHGPEGISLEEVHMSERGFSVLFGFTRAFFFVDLESVTSAVGYLKELIPDKPVDEWYSALGRVRQAKTERYRELVRHLGRSKQRFVTADGAKGMVMIVFTLPSYHLVFKVIRDRFAAVKTVTRNQVIQRYRLVANNDRAGRMIDAQAFRKLVFDRAFFSDELIHELLAEAGRTVVVTKRQVVFEHIYLERKVRPLNLYLREVSWSKARTVVRDYGEAIKEMARINIFPGDMLPKNFGVTRHERVIFYDFDEVCHLTDCRFRRLPDRGDDLMDLAGEPWSLVGEHDVFPEQFERFLGFKPELREVFLQYHRDLLAPGFWQQAQAACASNSVSP